MLFFCVISACLTSTKLLQFFDIYIVCLINSYACGVYYLIITNELNLPPPITQDDYSISAPFTNNHVRMTIKSNTIWLVKASDNFHWEAYLSGVRVHSHSKGAVIDILAIDLNVKFVLPSTKNLILYLIQGRRNNGYCDRCVMSSFRISCGE